MYFPWTPKKIHPRFSKTAMVVLTGAFLFIGAIFAAFWFRSPKNACGVFIFGTFKDFGTDDTYPGAKAQSPDTCSSMLYLRAYYHALTLCHEHRNDDTFLRLDFSINRSLNHFSQSSAATNMPSAAPLISIDDFCAQNYESLYSSLKALLVTEQPGRNALTDSMVRFAQPYQNKKLVTSLTVTTATSVFRENIHRTGVNETDFIPLKLEKAWQFPGLNNGRYKASKASPAIDESGIYVGSDDAWLYALDFEGKVRWQFYFSGAPQGIHSTVALDQEHVYVATYNGTLYALDKKSGQVVWANRLGFRLGSSPVLYKNFIYVAVETDSPMDGFLAKLHAQDGEISWVSPWLGEQSHASPTIDETGGSIYVGANNGDFDAFDLETGQLKTRLMAKGEIKTTAALIKNQIFFTSWAKALFAFDPLTNTTVWQTKLAARSRSSPTFVPGDDLFITADEEGNIYGINRKDGGILWKRPTGIKLMIASALVIRSGPSALDPWHAWIPCAKNTICALNPKTGSEVARLPLESDVSSVPVAWKGRLYLSLQREGGLMSFKPQ